MEPVTAALIASAVGFGAKGLGAGVKHLATRKSYAPLKKLAEKAKTRLGTGKYGMTAAQKREAAKQAAFATNAALSEQRANLQSLMGGLGGMQSGITAQQVGQLGQQSATAQALAAAETEKTSQQLAHQQKATDEARVQAHADKVARDWDWVGPAAETAVTTGLAAGAQQQQVNYDETIAELAASNA
jgi:hypothetical protein